MATVPVSDSRFPELEVSGLPRAMGQAIGEALREPIRAFCDQAIAIVRRVMPVTDAAAERIAHESIVSAEAYSPDMVEELRGTAEGAGVSLEAMMLLQVRNQLPRDAGGCTSLSLGAPLLQGRIVAQNWDNDPWLDPLTVVLTRRPTGKPAFVTVTQAGLIAYIGLSEAGIGLCLNTLPAPSRPEGVPHYFTVRGIYEARSLDEAVAAVRRAQRAIPANIMLTTPEGPADLEVTIDDVHVLRGTDRGLLTHTNHCRHDALLTINDRFPDLAQSRARQRRIDELCRFAPDRPPTVTDIQQVLRDHADYPHSICRHANDEPEIGHWQTVVSVIIEADSQTLHIARGTPCDREYELYKLR